MCNQCGPNSFNLPSKSSKNFPKLPKIGKEKPSEKRRQCKKGLGDGFCARSRKSASGKLFKFIIKKALKEKAKRLLEEVAKGQNSSSSYVNTTIIKTKSDPEKNYEKLELAVKEKKRR